MGHWLSGILSCCHARESGNPYGAYLRGELASLEDGNSAYACWRAVKLDQKYEESLVIGGILRKVTAAHTKLCSSRAFFISGYPGQSHEMLFDAHNRAFAALGGVAARGIYDDQRKSRGTT